MVRIEYKLPDGSGSVQVSSDGATARDWAGFFNALMPLVALILSALLQKPVPVSEAAESLRQLVAMDRPSEEGSDA